jgi:hypothetical protein
LPVDRDPLTSYNSKFAVVLNERFPEGASLQFNRLLAEPDTVIMVVLGDSPEADRICHLAAPTCANRGPLRRRLARAKVLQHAPTIARGHHELASVMNGDGHVLAFCLTTDRQVRGIIRAGMAVNIGTVMRSYDAATEAWETPAWQARNFARH